MYKKFLVFLVLLTAILLNVKSQAATPTATPTTTPYIINGDFSNTITASVYVNAYATPTWQIWEPGFFSWFTGHQGWNGPMPITQSAQSRTSPPAALVGDLNDFKPGYELQSDDSWMYHEMFVPSGSLDAKLEVYYRCHSESPFSGTSFQWQEAKIRNAGGGDLDTLFRLNTQTAAGVWWVESRDMNIYAGQWVQVYFNVHDDGGGTDDQLYMFVDDVSLIVNSTATYTVTPTETVTPTITPTNTITPTITKTFTITPTSTITPTITKTCTVTPYFIEFGEVVAYPNPVTGNEVVFMYSPESPVAEVTIEVFNLAGMKVTTLKDGAQISELNRKTRWNVTDVAPGLYLYRVVFDGTNGETTKLPFKKLVITK